MVFGEHDLITQLYDFIFNVIIQWYSQLAFIDGLQSYGQIFELINCVIKHIYYLKTIFYHRRHFNKLYLNPLIITDCPLNFFNNVPLFLFRLSYLHYLDDLRRLPAYLQFKQVCDSKLISVSASQHVKQHHPVLFPKRCKSFNRVNSQLMVFGLRFLPL